MRPKHEYGNHNGRHDICHTDTDTHTHMAAGFKLCMCVRICLLHIFVRESGIENGILLYFLQFAKYVLQRDILCSYAAVGRKGYFVIYGHKSSVIAVLLHMYVDIVLFKLCHSEYNINLFPN